MIRDTAVRLQTFPKGNKEGYWKMYLPVSEFFIASTKTPRYVKKAAMQTFINGIVQLIRIRPPELREKTRVVASIDLPDMWFSQFTIFFDETYYNGYFDRNHPDYKWIPLPPERNLLKEWGLTIPNTLTVKGYREEEYNRWSRDIWFIGELD